MAFTGGKEERDHIERAYNLTSDIGYVAKIVASGGIEAIDKIKVTPDKYPRRPGIPSKRPIKEE